MNYVQLELPFEEPTEARNRLFAIGDIHGDYDDFRSVLADMYADGMDLDMDTLVLIGDYIDGGSASAEVVGLIRELQELHGEDHVVALLGNHEDMMIAAWTRQNHIYEWYSSEEVWSLWWNQGGLETAASYSNTYGNMVAPDVTPEEMILDDIEWMKGLPLHYETDRFIFVHGGLAPNMSLEGTSDVQKLWIREPFLESRYDWGKLVVHGHSPNLYPQFRRNRLNIDTMLHGEGHVCGVEIIDRYVYTQYHKGTVRNVVGDGSRFSIHPNRK